MTVYADVYMHKHIHTFMIHLLYLFSSQDGMVVSGSHIIVLKPVKDSPYHLAYTATEVIVNNRTVDSTEGMYVCVCVCAHVCVFVLHVLI